MELHGPLNPSTGLPRRLEDFLAALDRIVDGAVAERADLVIMAGDIYKGRDPSPTHQREFARRVLRLSREGIPLILLAGNHDLPNAMYRAASIDIFRFLDVAGVHVARSADVLRLDTGAGPVLIATLPWVTRSTALAMVDSGVSTSMLDFYRGMTDLIGATAEELTNLA